MIVNQPIIDSAYDQGLRRYMLGIYNWMMLGMVLSAASAWFVTASGLLQELKSGGLLFWVAVLGPLGLVFAMSLGMRSMSLGALRVLFLAFAVLEGFSIAIITSAYTGASVVGAFVATSAAFAGLSLWGYTTKRDLSPWGGFLLMALIGLIVVMVLNVFIGSGVMGTLISLGAVVLFAGFMAHDTQELKMSYYPGAGSEHLARVQLMGALNLYLDFLNMFIHLLQLFGSSDD